MLNDTLSFIVIVNPFALSLYLTGVMDDLDSRSFVQVLLNASILSLMVFVVFALSGELVITRFFGVGPNSLKIFGGIVISIVAYAYVIRGYRATENLRGSLEELPSAIAVPFMVGAGSLTKCILIGKSHPAFNAIVVVAAGVGACFLWVILFMLLRHRIRKKREVVFDRYINMLARVNGLLLGAVAMEMIVTGTREVWGG